MDQVSITYKLVYQFYRRKPQPDTRLERASMVEQAIHRKPPRILAVSDFYYALDRSREPLATVRAVEGWFRRFSLASLEQNLRILVCCPKSKLKSYDQTL